MHKLCKGGATGGGARLQCFIAPDPAGRAQDAPPDPQVSWVGRYSSPIPTHLTPTASRLFAVLESFLPKPMVPRLTLFCFAR